MDKVTWSQVVRSVEECVRADIESGELDPHDDDALYEYASVWADSSEWTIYNYHVMNLWVDSSTVSDYESDATVESYGESIIEIMRRCVYLALHDLIRETVEEIREG